MRTIKQSFVLLLVLVLLLCIAGGAAFAAADDSGSSQPDLSSFDFDRHSGFSSDDAGFVAGEVLAPAASLAEAQDIAAAYGLELKSYAYGIAVLAAPDAQAAVAQSMAMAAQNMQTPQGGLPLPQLSLNWLYYSDDRDLLMQDTQLITFNPLFSTQAIEQPADGFSQWQHAVLDTERAWAISKGAGITVAVIDSGIDVSHPAFAGRISPKSYNAITNQVGLEYVQDDNWHGTHVSGIVAGALDSNIGVCGIAPQVDILAIKANLDGYTSNYDTASVLRGIEYAEQNGARVINMSLRRAYTFGPSDLERNIIAKAVAKGIVIVCAAGNENAGHAGYPAAYAETIAVSALNYKCLFEYSFSNYGPEIDIIAPGAQMYSAYPGGGYAHGGGTSMATPCVAGVAALILAKHPEYTAQQVRDIICQTAREAGDLGRDDYYGHGVLNAYAALLGPSALHNITFDYNDGRSPVFTKVAPGGKLLKPHAPQRTGYAFRGWYIVGSNNLYNFADTVNGNLNLYAQWVTPQAGMYITEFPDKNFRREVLRLLNEDGKNRADGNFVADDLNALAAITALEMHNMAIQDLTGLAYFSGLQTLYCNNNQLTLLAVPANSKLKNLYCARNNLTKLDISGCITLEQLVCSHNQLREFVAPKNSALERLDCEYNQLTTLNVSGNAALTTLICNDNSLTALNISGNTALKTLFCNRNRLPALDLSQCTQLEGLICDYNQLTALNVSGNTALKWLYCGINQLIGLDISSNTALIYLDCTYNYLRSTNDVIGWQQSGLVLGDTFRFYQQMPISGENRFGKVLYQDSTRPAIVRLYDWQGILTYPATTAADGAYMLTAPAGASYKLVVSKPGYLSYTINNLTLTELENIETIDIRQLAGDINGDGIVNAVDLTLLLSEFNRIPLNFQYADIDGNGIVNAADLTFLLAGFNKRNVIIDKNQH